MMKILLFLSLFAFIHGATQPPMGWSSFCFQEKFSFLNIEVCDPAAANANDILNNAQILQSTFRDFGYNLIIIENSWSSPSRDTQTGELVGSDTFLANKFKSMSEFISALKSQGFKVGIATSATEKACYGNGAGSFNNYQKDIKTFLNWGVDYIKLEWCDGASLPPNTTTIKSLFQQFGGLLRAANPSIFFAASEFNDDTPWTWGSGFSDSWRIGPTHIPWFWNALDTSKDTSHIIEYLVGKSKYAGPQKGWNDPDFILDQRLDYQYQTQVAIWSITNSPLIFSTDMSKISSAYQKILLNKDIISINQDTTSVGDRISASQGQVWAKKLKNNDIAVVLYNDNYLPFESQTVTVQFSQLGWPSDSIVDIKDVITGKEHKGIKGSYGEYLGPETTSILILTLSSSTSTTGDATTGDATTGSSSSTTGDSTTGGTSTTTSGTSTTTTTTTSTTGGTTSSSTTGKTTSTTGGHTTTTGASTGHTTHATTGAASTLLPIQFLAFFLIVLSLFV